LRLEHPIFNKPLDPKIKLEPDDWEKDFDPRGTWLVQTGELGLGKGNDYGIVSDGHGFEDSPDCERISGGVNSKGPYAVAIGRQANLLQWGFYAAPDRMTESAKKVFLNAIVYMKPFDGRKPLVKKEARGRGWYAQYVAGVRKLDTIDAKYRDSYRKYLKSRFPAEVIKEHGLDADALERWRKANVEYIYSKKRYELAVDSDLQKLQLSNRKPEFLAWVVKRLSGDPKDSLALKLAGRYLGPNGKDAKTAIAWILENRNWLFFSDQGGYRWYVDANARRAARHAKEAGGEKERIQRVR
jgi:hypothetical protein